jgi:hypothetical protein
MFSSLFNTTNQAIIKRIQARYDNTSKQLIAFLSSCPAAIKNEYKESVTFMEEHVSSLLATCSACGFTLKENRVS